MRNHLSYPVWEIKRRSVVVGAAKHCGCQRSTRSHVNLCSLSSWCLNVLYVQIISVYFNFLPEFRWMHGILCIFKWIVWACSAWLSFLSVTCPWCNKHTQWHTPPTSRKLQDLQAGISDFFPKPSHINSFKLLFKQKAAE